MKRPRTSSLLAWSLAGLALATSGLAGYVEDFNSLLEQAREQKKDIFMLVISPVPGAQQFARLLAADKVRKAYQDRFLAFPVFLGDLKEKAPAERAQLAALLELFQAEPGPHPVFVFLSPTGVAYRIVRPTLSSSGVVEVTAESLTEVFDEATLDKARRAKAAFVSVVETVAKRPGPVAARELAGLLEKLPPFHRRLPEGKRALGALLGSIGKSEDPSLIAIRDRWHDVALKDAQQAALWQVRRMAWAADIQGSVDTAEDLCRTAKDPGIRREACITGTQVLIAIDKPGALAKAKELLRIAKKAAETLGEHADDPDPVTGIPGATPEDLEKTLVDVEERRANAHGATSKTISLGEMKPPATKAP